ncbi:MAG TPA: ankyrin repeat domain-containing protein [Gammaproteobacteria bacterium]|nr:ankyrin repeat domain-containing protein [Gammaproteobacteria bacterium]
MRTLSRLGAFALLLMLSLGALAASDLDAKLLAAAQKSQTAEVRALLAAGADANARAADGSTPLIYATHFGDTAGVQALLAAKGDPNITNRYGVGPMHEAALRADAGLLRVLLDAGAEVDLALPQGETALMLASRTSGVEAVRLLIERGAKVNVVEKWQGQTPLMYAAAHDRGEVAAALIAAGADVNARTPINDLPERKPAVRYFVEIPLAGLTPVMFAARHGALSALRELIKAKADLNAKTPEGFPPVVIALDNLHFDAAKMLVEAGASTDGGGLYAVVEARNRVNYVGELQVPTGAESSLELLKLMLAHGANLMDRLPDQLLDRDVRFLPPPPKITDLALIRAARSSDVEAMRVLIEGGADPSLRDEKRGGITPLVAVLMGPELPALIEAERRPSEQEAIAAVDFLLDHGVAPSIANDMGSTALHIAALRDYPGVIRHMAERGVDLNVADREGFTPLDYALGRAPARLRVKPPAEVTAAAIELRKLGAHGKDEQRTAAR